MLNHMNLRKKKPKNQPRYIYYLLASNPLTFYRYRSCVTWWNRVRKKWPNTFFRANCGFGWLVVREDTNTGKRIIYDLPIY